MGRQRNSPLYCLLAPALEFLVDDGVISSYAMAHEELFWVNPKTPTQKPDDHPKDEAFNSWASLAWQLSQILGGQFWPGENGCTWSNGPYAIWMTSAKKEEDIKRARAILHKITGIEDLPCSVAGCARTLLGWVGVRQPRPKSCEQLLTGIKHHYQHCTPKTSTRATLFDVKACHATLLSRMPSPLISICNGKILFRPLPREVRQRWIDATNGMYEHKGLRNAFIGNMMGAGSGKNKLVFYSHGNRSPGPHFSGVLRPAGLLVVRTAYELCAEVVAESRAIYSNQDCVITEDGLHDSNAWSRAGLRVELRAEGESEICSVGVYRVGQKQTKWYEAGSRTQHPSRALTVNGPTYGMWLDNVRMAA